MRLKKRMKSDTICYSWLYKILNIIVKKTLLKINFKSNTVNSYIMETTNGKFGIKLPVKASTIESQSLYLRQVRSEGDTVWTTVLCN